MVPLPGFLCVKVAHRMSLLFDALSLDPYAKVLELEKDVCVLDVRMFLTLKMFLTLPCH